jgi:hypothetical protein
MQGLKLFMTERYSDELLQAYESTTRSNNAIRVVHRRKSDAVVCCHFSERYILLGTESSPGSGIYRQADGGLAIHQLIT